MACIYFAIFGESSSLLLLVDRGGRLVWSAEEKASLSSAHFDTKQCRDSFQQPHFCDPSPVLYILLHSGLALFAGCFWI